MSIAGQCLTAFIFGTLVGILVQRSRFCNTAALRDAILFKSYRNTKALIIAMIILTIGFTAFISVGEGHTMHFDVGLNQLIGLFLFGIGMVLAGACTVSTWVKAGEGNIGAIWALLFTFVGMFLFSLLWSVNYWPPAPASMSGEPNLEALQFGRANAATLQEKFGIPAIFFGIIQSIVLYVIYLAMVRRERATEERKALAIAAAAAKKAAQAATSPAAPGTVPVGAEAPAE